MAELRDLTFNGLDYLITYLEKIIRMRNMIHCIRKSKRPDHGQYFMKSFNHCFFTSK